MTTTFRPGPAFRRPPVQQELPIGPRDQHPVARLCDLLLATPPDAHGSRWAWDGPVYTSGTPWATSHADDGVERVTVVWGERQIPRGNMVESLSVSGTWPEVVERIRAAAMVLWPDALRGEEAA